MQFAIIAFDGADDEAIDRRLRVRQEHISLGDEMVKSGQALFGGAILNDDKMIGSIEIVEFASRQELDEYLATEPYVLGEVWKDIQVLPFRVGPSFSTEQG